MKFHFHLLSVFCCFISAGIAQAESDAVRDAIEKFEKTRREKKQAEVTVVLEPPPAAVPVEESPPAIPDKPAPPIVESGENSAVLDESQVAPEEPNSPEPVAEPSATTTELPDSTPALPPPAAPEGTQKGVIMRVDPITAGSGMPDDQSLQIHAPFPAKPLSHPPAGWNIVPSEQIQPFSENVKLNEGKSITLTIKPHVLVPEADGFLTFSVPEPGYDPSLEYHQTATVGAVLSRSIRELDEDSKQLGSVLDQLEQILFSLPQPKAKAIIVGEDPPSPEPNSSPE